MRIILAIGFIILSFTWTRAQYISEVLEYVPAPGQFTNTLPWGTPHAASTIIGGVNGSMCLGAFGGYVVFRFEEAVENDPGNPFGIDFTIFGNPMAHWSEPGVVWVMKDENENGQADDTWYELAGSDYYFSSTVRNYQLTYVNPVDTVAKEVPWFDQFGKSGVIKTNSVHLQPYYPLQDSFPFISNEQYVLKGTLIQGAVDVDHPPVLISVRRIFGYADNQMRGLSSLNLPDNPYTPEVENSGGDAFDIHWAVDSTGAYVDLDKIHFVKVQNGMMADGKWLGELSTEITGAVDVAPDLSLSGTLDLVVVRDLPDEISGPEYQLEVFAFYQGRIIKDPDIDWISSNPEVFVDEQHMLRATGTGPVSLTAYQVDKPLIKTTVSTTIVASNTSTQEGIAEFRDAQMYPNPASELVQISGIEEASLSFFTVDGKCELLLDQYHGGAVDIGSLPSGIYMVRIDHGASVGWLKLLKN